MTLIIHRSVRKSGLTLVELLITIACIAVLLALIFPAYQATTGASDQLRCVEKLRNLGGAALQYAHDHQGQMPSADWNQPNGRKRTGADGSYTVRGGMLEYLEPWKIPGESAPTEVAWCPAERRAHRAPVNSWQTYTLNTFAKGVAEQMADGTPAFPSYTYAPRIVNIPLKAQMAMFLDGVKPTFGGGYAVYPSTVNASTFLNKQDSYYPHGNQINVVYMDGHVDRMDRSTLRKLTTSTPFWSGGME